MPFAQWLRQPGDVLAIFPCILFVRNRGRVLSREQLLDLVGGQDTFVTDRVVDKHVVTPRKKIESEPCEPRYVPSVRGMGYRFDG